MRTHVLNYGPHKGALIKITDSWSTLGPKYGVLIYTPGHVFLEICVHIPRGNLYEIVITCVTF